MGGKPSKQRAQASISPIDRATLDLKNARDRLSKYKVRLEQDEARLTDRARKAKQAGNAKSALQLLKIKKMKRNEAESVEGQLLTVLQMVQTIDSKQNEKAVLEAMKTGKDALQKMHEQTSVDDVIQLMDQIAEQSQVEQEISALLGQGHETALSLDDEAAIEAELEALVQQDSVHHQLPQVPTDKPQTLPVVPDNKLPDRPDAAPEGKVALAS